MVQKVMPFGMMMTLAFKQQSLQHLKFQEMSQTASTCSPFPQGLIYNRNREHHSCDDGPRCFLCWKLNSQKIIASFYQEAILKTLSWMLQRQTSSSCCQESLCAGVSNKKSEFTCLLSHKNYISHAAGPQLEWVPSPKASVSPFPWVLEHPLI